VPVWALAGTGQFCNKTGMSRRPASDHAAFDHAAFEAPSASGRLGAAVSS
jgi:hypothetical protein